MADAAQTEDETDASPALTAELCLGRLHSHVRYKVLERGRFPWPSAADGTARLTAAQLAMLWEGMDWRRPPGRRRRREQPEKQGDSGRNCFLESGKSAKIRP